MPADRNSTTTHRLAFAHYLRTGERFTNAEWLRRSERKFNPYHDAEGRFTSPPGVTVSWGRGGANSGKRERAAPKVAASSAGLPSRSASRTQPREKLERNSSVATKPSAATGFRSDQIRDATEPAGHAESYFQLNKRQAGLNRLREAAGANPGEAVRADLDDFQKRLDADRARLDARAPIINAQTTELLRAGMVPVDIGAGALNIATGKGEVRDYLSVGAAVPAGAIVRRVGGIVQIGGAQSVVKRLIKAENIQGLEIHHVPSVDSLRKANIPIRPSEMPVTAPLIKDHRATQSWGGWTESKIFRQEVADRMMRGDVDGALRMEFDDMERVGAGYGHSAEEIERYIYDHLNKFRR